MPKPTHQIRFKTLVGYKFLSNFAPLEPLRFCEAGSPLAGTELVLVAEAAWYEEHSKQKKAIYCA